MPDNYRPIVLIILDGWGMRQMEEGNAVLQAHTPNYDRWQREHERSILTASGEAVGLPQDQMGNSEVGHLNLGAGRVVYQDFTRINMAIKDGSFFSMAPLLEGITHARENGGKVHIIGLLGPGGVHSHVEHLYATIKLAHEYGMTPVLHLITDGRDTPPRSAVGFLEGLEAFLEEYPADVATVSGRYYAMDRDRRWQRTELAYQAMVSGDDGRPDTRRAESARGALRASYEEGTTDEFVLPTVIESGRDTTVSEGDTLVFHNFRADRMRQIVRAFVDPDFDGFKRKYVEDIRVITFTEYEDGLPAQVVFPEQNVEMPLAAVLSELGLTQFHAAETEKYAHVTYFFNGGWEKQFEGEARHLEASPQVATYDLQPEMSAEPLTEAVLQRLRDHDDDFILVNFANPDMVGHTGVLEAAVRAVEAVDACAGRLVDAVVGKGGVALVTADHGNAERMIDIATGGAHTYHTTNPVPLFIIGGQYWEARPEGKLADVAPTILALLGVEQPEEMTGRSLLEHAGL